MSRARESGDSKDRCWFLGLPYRHRTERSRWTGRITMTKTNAELELDVNEELGWDPKVDSEEIAVAVDDGTVTLRGTVGSFRQKREATKAAQRIYGVLYVNNDLDVRILDDDRHDDADLRGDVLQALMLDTLLPATIDASVKEGFVTLTGTTT